MFLSRRLRIGDEGWVLVVQLGRDDTGSIAFERECSTLIDQVSFCCPIHIHYRDFINSAEGQHAVGRHFSEIKKPRQSFLRQINFEG